MTRNAPITTVATAGSRLALGAREVGADAHLPKPFAIDELNSKVGELLPGLTSRDLS